jgi:hypothetical protein
MALQDHYLHLEKTLFFPGYACNNLPSAAVLYALSAISLAFLGKLLKQQEP